MTVRPKILWFGVAILLIAGLIYRHGRVSVKGVPAQPTATAITSAASKSNLPVAAKPATDTAASQPLKFRRDAILATVNGHPIRLRDVIPLTGTNDQGEVELSASDLKFFLDRAVNRELIFEAAKAQGVMLDDSQQQQLAQFSSLRSQREPGLVQRFNASPANDDLELLDAQAFSLQTSLLARQGVSPDVSDTQVSDYYQQHSDQFVGMPTDLADYQIRTLLAPAQRAQYQSQLMAYMNQVRSAAVISEPSL